MKKAALYVRVSTNYQIDKDSLPLQKKDLINYASMMLGISKEHVVVFEDAGYSGKNTDRPAYQDMMSRIRKKEFTHLLVWKIDRISRNLLDFAGMYDELKECGVIFVSRNEQFDTSSAMGEAMLKIILVFAELERNMTSERVSAIMLSRAEKGLWNGANVPLGYRWDPETKYPQIDDEESQKIRFIFDTYEDKKSSTYLAKYLNANKIKTKRDGYWTTKTLGDIIRNPFYKGTLRYNVHTSARGKKKPENEWVVVENNHPGIISEEQWQRCNDIMDNNRKGVPSRIGVYHHVFSGLITCGECGKRYQANKADEIREDGYRPSLYRCASKYSLQCPAPGASDITIGPFVINYIGNLIKVHQKFNLAWTPDKLQRELLSGELFGNIKEIKSDGLHETYESLLSRNATYEEYKAITGKAAPITESAVNDIKMLTAEKDKTIRALTRLQNLFLFDENAMSEKDFIVTKKQLQDTLDTINVKLRALERPDQEGTSLTDMSYLSKSTAILLLSSLTAKEPADIRSLEIALGKESIKSFINHSISDILFKDGMIQSIEFKNGIRHTFVYKPQIHLV